MNSREYDDDEINLAEVEEIAHAPDQSIIREVSDDEINLAEVEEITHAPDQSIITEASDDEINFYLDQQRLIEQIKLISQEQPVAKKSFNLQNFILEKKVPNPLIFASVLTCSIIAIISFSSLTFLDVIYKAYENSQSQSSNKTISINATNEELISSLKSSSISIMSFVPLTASIGLFCSAFSLNFLNNLVYEISRRKLNNDISESLININSIDNFLIVFKHLTAESSPQEEQVGSYNELSAENLLLLKNSHQKEQFYILNEFLNKQYSEDQRINDDSILDTDMIFSNLIIIPEDPNQRLNLFNATKSFMLAMKPNIFLESFEKLSHYFNMEEKNKILKDFIEQYQPNLAEELSTDSPRIILNIDENINNQESPSITMRVNSGNRIHNLQSQTSLPENL